MFAGRPGPSICRVAGPEEPGGPDPGSIWDSTPGSAGDEPARPWLLPARAHRPNIPRGGPEPLHIPFIAPPITASFSGRSLLNSVPGHSVPDLAAEAGGGPDDEPR